MQAKNNRVSIVVAAVPFLFSFFFPPFSTLCFYSAVKKENLHSSDRPGEQVCLIRKFQIKNQSF
jgi:hypothetical protein